MLFAHCTKILEYIFVFQEQQKQKVLFYYPKDDSLDRKLRNIGLCEAIINFTRSFSPSKPCEAVHTLKTRQVLLEAEPDIWMSMVITRLYLTNCTSHLYFTYLFFAVKFVLGQGWVFQCFRLVLRMQ